MREAIHYVGQVAAIFAVTQGNPWPEDARKVGALLDEVIKDVRTDCDEAMRLAGEHHVEQIANWEGEVETLEARLKAQEEAAELSRQTIERLTVRAAELSELAETNRKNGQAWKSKFDEAEKINTGLLDDLHRLTVENAELRGYQRRVTEFDPLSERELTDRAERPMAPVNPRADSGFDAAWARAEANCDKTPWHRRRPL